MIIVPTIALRRLSRIQVVASWESLSQLHSPRPEPALGVSLRPAPASWERSSQLHSLGPVQFRRIAQIQVGNGIAFPNFPNLIFSISVNQLRCGSSCGGFITPFRGGKGTPSSCDGRPIPHFRLKFPACASCPPSPEDHAMPIPVVRKIAFVVPPILGTLLMVDGQRFEVIALVDHCRRDGMPTVLIRWASHCAECGQPFTQTTSMTAKNPNRRCPMHHAPGLPVTAEGQKRKHQFLARYPPHRTTR